MFEISTQGAVQVLTGSVPLNAEKVADVRMLAREAIRRNQPRMVLDFRGVPLIDSAGLELLLEMRDDCLRAGGGLQLANLGPLCHDILTATGVADEFAIFDNVAAAVGSFAR